MLYEPVKDRLIGLAARSQLLRQLYYVMLNVVFLRSWYVRRAIRRLMSESGAESIRMLDAGTGLGQFAYYAASRNPNVRVHAVDINKHYVEYARRFISRTRCAPRVTFGLEDLTRLRTAGPYDLILSVDVMEHIEDDVGVFRHFARVLRPGGYVVINTPSDLGGSDVREAGEEGFIGEHVRDGYSQEELSEKLQSAGLKVTDTIYTYGKAGSLAWRLLIKIPMQLISASRLLAVIAVPYFLLVLPVGIVLNALDMRTANETGTGILVVAQRR
jgi:2-polyprenyl-3-methyl-5-hydroxy-6-metoxy-1,4-benzoquinol methylase